MQVELIQFYIYRLYSRLRLRLIHVYVCESRNFARHATFTAYSLDAAIGHDQISN